jgi:hypothetical protein
VLSDPFTETVARMGTIQGIDRQPVEGVVVEMDPDRELSRARGKRRTAGFPWTDRAVGPGYGTTTDEVIAALKGAGRLEGPVNSSPGKRQGRRRGEPAGRG